MKSINTLFYWLQMQWEERSMSCWCTLAKFWKTKLLFNCILNTLNTLLPQAYFTITKKSSPTVTPFPRSWKLIDTEPPSTLLAKTPLKVIRSPTRTYTIIFSCGWFELAYCCAIIWGAWFISIFYRISIWGLMNVGLLS